MAWSSSLNSDGSSKSVFRSGGPGFVCFCKLHVAVRDSHSVANPSRRYMWCPKYSGMQCDFFLWLDPPNPRFWEGKMSDTDINEERQKRYNWIAKYSMLDQQFDGLEAKSKELEGKIGDLKVEKKKIKKELMICRFVICSLFILLVALKLG